jgi:guanosine-3',5'-bis(diphosphate) 3'-pyrophosphohydrolase
MSSTSPKEFPAEVALTEAFERVYRQTQRNDPRGDLALLRRAFLRAKEIHAGHRRESGEPYILHLLAVAQILAELRLDAITVSSALLHDSLEDTSLSKKTLTSEFGEEVALLVEGASKLSRFSPDAELYEARNLRRMLLAMAKDVRVVLIKLADRLHNLRTLEHKSAEDQRRIAQESMDIFAPLANRMGMGLIRWEMEDLCFRYLEPGAYQQISAQVAKKRDEREQIISTAIAQVSELCVRASIKAKITGRPKHFYSIWRKMQEGHSFQEVTDLHGMRIVVNSIRHCYAVLGLVHTALTPVPGRFKDYIALPKTNGYQSIHTVVVDKSGQLFEFQIRTAEMHRRAEVGIAAHWRYKEGVKPTVREDQSLSFLDKVLEWQTDLVEPGQILDALRRGLFEEEVLVFTPKGQVKEFPLGATPLDFAFEVHTEVGKHAVGAKVNGRIVPFTYRLRTGDVVEIMTSGHALPSRDWLEIVVTSRARHKIRQYLRETQETAYRADGQKRLEEEARRRHLKLGQLRKREDYRALLPEYGFEGEESFLVALGDGRVSAAGFLDRLLKGKEVARHSSALVSDICQVDIAGSSDFDYRLAGCCLPSPPEPIVAFVTKNRGVTIHKSKCPNIARAKKERLQSACWLGGTQSRKKIVRLTVEAKNWRGLLAELSVAITSMGIDIINADAKAVAADSKSRIRFMLIISVNFSQHSLVNRIANIPGVEKVRLN